MAKRILICLSHSIEEHDQLKLLHGLGYEVASIGGYIDPAHPHDGKRGPLPDIPCVPEVKDAVDALGTTDNFGAAQARIPEAILEWLGKDGTIIYHHYLSERLFPQWEHLREWREAGGRIVWRTVGQSVENNEREAQPYREDGLEVVRYSPQERNIPGYVGKDALIRFYKDPAEWHAWEGGQPVVTNVTQFLRDRDPWTNYGFWAKATEGLPVFPLGPGSDQIGGPGELPEYEMKFHLRYCGAYLYTGTQPASYTLGLLEALMVGIPVVSIGPSWMRVFPYGHELFEGHKLSPCWSDDPLDARGALRELLQYPAKAQRVAIEQRERAIEIFGVDTVGAAWKQFLG